MSLCPPRHDDLIRSDYTICPLAVELDQNEKISKLMYKPTLALSSKFVNLWQVCGINLVSNQWFCEFHRFLSCQKVINLTLYKAKQKSLGLLLQIKFVSFMFRPFVSLICSHFWGYFLNFSLDFNLVQVNARLLYVLIRNKKQFLNRFSHVTLELHFNFEAQF